MQGIVQGVGFRPFVYGLAQRYALGGFVLNNSNGVLIEIEGESPAVDAFIDTLQHEPPPLARIEAVQAEMLPPRGELVFSIAHSAAGAARRTLIAPDTATCDDCLREVFDPADRRFGYPFINCTNCGPRFTIVQDVPYDRANTTMRAFPMCPACHAEYDDPLNRRFHAQPNACPVCGPQVWFESTDCARDVLDLPPLDVALVALEHGAILAIKGLGGYHLACDAWNNDAVNQLRTRKHREAKPFALMVADLAAARRLCHVSDEEAALLSARQRPIVLLERLATCDLPLGIAPGQTALGIMLPYTPLHHLLLRRMTGHHGRPTVLVLTSGNHSDEPIAYRDEDARSRLIAIADGILGHNRPIHTRCDDSVARVVAGGMQMLRRSRGYAPEPLMLATRAPLPVLAVGGHLKNTFCLLNGNKAFVGHHIGDLENLETLTSFHEGIAHFERLFDCAPGVVAHDLHPDYLATKAALALGLPTVAVQHHHAHIASVLAEHGRSDTVIGVAADGTGYGDDGAIWGGEILLADLRSYRRLAHLRTVPLPGGDRAVREPWRVAAALLHQQYGDDWQHLPISFAKRIDGARWRVLAQMIGRGLNSPPTSSMGRLFDAVAALLGLRDVVLYEGQAAIELETAAWQARRAPDASAAYPLPLLPGAPAQFDTGALLAALLADTQRGVATPLIALRFHRSVAAALADACATLAAQHSVGTVALSGGVFQNRLLLGLLSDDLRRRGLEVLLNRQVPPNDGGLSLGQAAIAAAMQE